MADYTFWRDCLAGHKPALAMGEVHPGFWRVRRERNGPLLGLATWASSDGQILYMLDHDTARPADGNFATTFSFAIKNAVTEAVYREWFRQGAWPDQAPTRVYDPLADDGSNAGETDVYEALRREIDEQDLEVKRFLKAPIADQTAADRATNWSNDLQKILKRRDEAFEEEKKPLREQATACDKKWKPLKDSLEDLRKLLHKAQEPFLLAKAKAEREAREAAEARRQADFAEGKAPAVPRAAPAAAPAARSGSGGRSTRVVKVAKARIEDFDKLLMALKGHGELKALVAQLADRAAKAGIPLDGMVIYEEDEVRR